MWVYRVRQRILRREHWDSGRLGPCKYRNEMKVDAMKEENTMVY